MNNSIDIAELFIGFGEFLKSQQTQRVDNISNISDTKYLMQAEVLEEYPFTPSTLYNATRYKGLPYIKNGKHRYYKKSDIEEWIDKNIQVKQDKLMFS